MYKNEYIYIYIYIFMKRYIYIKNNVCIYIYIDINIKKYYIYKYMYISTMYDVCLHHTEQNNHPMGRLSHCRVSSPCDGWDG